MVLQKVVEEGQLEVTDTLIDDNNAAIRVNVGALGQSRVLFFSGLSHTNDFDFPAHREHGGGGQVLRHPGHPGKRVGHK